MPIEKHSTPYYKFSIDLEKDLVIGNFSLDKLNQKQAPSKYYSAFIETISRSLQQEIINIIEVSSNNLTVAQCLNLFKLENAQELQTFVNDQAKLAFVNLIFYKENRKEGLLGIMMEIL